MHFLDTKANLKELGASENKLDHIMFIIAGHFEVMKEWQTKLKNLETLGKTN